MGRFSVLHSLLRFLDKDCCDVVGAFASGDINERGVQHVWSGESEQHDDGGRLGVASLPSCGLYVFAGKEPPKWGPSFRFPSWESCL